jgi:hypothetical protein
LESQRVPQSSWPGFDPAIQTTPSAVAVSLDRRVKPGEDKLVFPHERPLL